MKKQVILLLIVTLFFWTPVVFAETEVITDPDTGNVTTITTTTKLFNEETTPGNSQVGLETTTVTTHSDTGETQTIVEDEDGNIISGETTFADGSSFSYRRDEKRGQTRRTQRDADGNSNTWIHYDNGDDYTSDSDLNVTITTTDPDTGEVTVETYHNDTGETTILKEDADGNPISSETEFRDGSRMKWEEHPDGSTSTTHTNTDGTKTVHTRYLDGTQRIDEYDENGELIIQRRYGRHGRPILEGGFGDLEESGDNTETSQLTETGTDTGIFVGDFEIPGVDSRDMSDIGAPETERHHP